MSETIHYIQSNWFQIAIDLVAASNVIIAGSKAMGWNKLADECQKVENAIQAMVSAALNKNKGDDNVKKDNSVSVNGSSSTDVKSS